MSMLKNPPLADLVAIMARLRDPATGCPWDVEQSFRTIAPYTIEEAYEVADAIERDDMDALKDELGDLLLQVVFHARMAEEVGHFDVSDVIAAICDKMIRRHPHVFSDVEASDGNTVLRNWESIKAGERAAKSADSSALAGIAFALPALLRAEKLQKRAARVGFDWPDAAGPRAKIIEELDEVADAASFNELEDEIGDLIFATVNLARHMKIDPETALRRANLKFETRFRSMEMRVGDRFSSLSPEAKEALWIEAKADERT
jgi:ATP diphosphatase